MIWLAAGETNRPLRVLSVLRHKEIASSPRERVRPQNSCTTDVETTTFISKEDHRRVDRSHSFHNEQPREEKPKTRNRPLCFQKAQSFCELIFALFVPRIYSLSSLSAISERIGESPVCDVS